MKLPILLLACIFLANGLVGQTILLEADQLEASKVYMTVQQLGREKVVKVVKDSTEKEVDEATFVRLKNMDFKDGTIEVTVLSRLLSTAAPTDRGFIGIAFRINDNNTQFECIYLRPTNGRANEQVRRNHSIQYFSFPDYKFFRLRKESPEMYESYADMGLNEWTKMKIVVSGTQALLYHNNQKQPSLIVNDLKLGGNLSGSVGLFVDVGTEGFFKDLKITKTKSASSTQ